MKIMVNIKKLTVQLDQQDIKLRYRRTYLQNSV